MSNPETDIDHSHELREHVLSAGVLQEGHFVFAAGGHGLVKLEMDALWDDEKAIAAILEALAQAKELPETDVILGVPTGGQRLAEAVAQRYLQGIPFARLERIPGGAKQDYRFSSEEDRMLALSAQSPRIYEDVVSTYSSVSGVVRLLDPTRQDIHSLAVWRRGTVQDQYRLGATDHYLIEEEIPIYAPDECPHPMHQTDSVQ